MGATFKSLQESMKYLLVLTDEYTYETDEFRINSSINQ
jgi:hypothetical protein